MSALKLSNFTAEHKELHSCSCCDRVYVIAHVPKNRPQYNSRGELVGYIFDCICLNTLMVKAYEEEK